MRRVQEEIDALREVLAFAFEASLLMGQAQQTAITRSLAAWAAILAVPTAVAGLYGMNFDHMPELKWRYGYFAVLGGIACPTLVMCGAEDRLCPPDWHRDMAVAIPGAALEVIAGAGHLPPLEQPERFSRVLAAWLAERA